MRVRSFPVAAAASIAAVFPIGAARADGSVWLPAPGSGSVTVSWVSQSADNMWVGSAGPQPIPFKGLDQTTLLIDVDYGFSDALALDARVGAAEVEPKHGGPQPHATDGITDLEVGLTWRFRDEIVSGGPSVAVRGAAIVAGNYPVGGYGPPEAMREGISEIGAGPTAIGDGADGFEASVIVGKFFDNRFALSGELGVRNRNDGVPTETWLNLDAYAVVGARTVLFGQYRSVMSDGDLDIGGPPSTGRPGKHGFNWYNFPRIAEEVDLLSLGGSVQVNDRINLGLQWFQVLDGRNAAEYDAVGGTLTYSFGGGVF